ncbi:MAG: SRPBCC domain-containing protein, partial [Gimesia chilikensis]
DTVLFCKVNGCPDFHRPVRHLRIADNVARYEALNPPSQIVFRQYNANAAGDIVGNPQMPDWPMEIRATVNLTEQDGVTTMEFVWVPVDPSDEEMQAWNAAREQLGYGWGGGFEQLEVYLQSLQ